MLKAILFDLDETLLHEIKSAEAVITETVEPVCREHGIDPREMMHTVFETARPIWHSMPTHPYCKRVAISSWEGLWGPFTGDHPDLVELRKIVHDYRVQTWYDSMKAYGLDLPETAERIALSYPEARKKRHVQFPETKEVMDKLFSMYPMALLTNGTPSVQWAKIKGGGVEKYFKHVIISGDLETRKPDPVIFNTILDRLGLHPGQAIMVGDNLRSDIAGASGAGIKSVWVNRWDEVLDDAASPDYIIKDLRELFDILN